MKILLAVLQTTLAAGEWSDLSRVEPRSSVTVTAQGELGVRGKFVGVSDSTITIEVRGQAKAWPRADVLNVFRSKRASMKKPVLLGMAIGAGGGAAIGAAAGGCRTGDFICFDRRYTTPAAALLGAVFGAASGTFIGLHRRETVLIYQKSTAAGSRISP